MRASTEIALHRDPVLWLSSVCPDGRPHVVPLWFAWDGEWIVAFSKPNARKLRNLRGDPRAMLAIGTPGLDFEVEGGLWRAQDRGAWPLRTLRANCRTSWRRLTCD
jgi:hypothetical protein